MKSVPTCYMCPDPGITIEHAPARAFFPEMKDLPQGMNLRKNLITVPSCEEHNTRIGKTKDDEFIYSVVASAHCINQIGQNHYKTKVRRALQYNPSKKSVFYRNARPAILDGAVVGQFDVDKERAERTFSWMARAVFYDHHDLQEKWLSPVTVVPLDLLTPQSLQMTLGRIYQDIATARVFDEAERHGENPEVFYYQLHRETRNGHLVTVMKLVFYDGFRVLVSSLDPI